METQEKVATPLEELKGSGYEISNGQPDITGWDIKTRSGKRAGVVSDLLFDADLRKVRYIIADLSKNELNLSGNRKVLIPIGIAELYTYANRRNHYVDPALSLYDPSTDGNVVYLPSVSARQLDTLPLYEKGRLSRHTEIAIRQILEPNERPQREEDAFYRHQHFNDERFYDQPDR
jgi:hypothetical protein